MFGLGIWELLILAAVFLCPAAVAAVVIAMLIKSRKI